MDPLILKLLLTPTLVLLVALAQRRLGERIGGRLAALPPTSGPLVLVVVCGQGSAAGRALVEGILTGIPAAVVFFVVYAALADRQRWWTCAATATVASVLTGGGAGLAATPDVVGPHRAGDLLARPGRQPPARLVGA